MVLDTVLAILNDFAYLRSCQCSRDKHIMALRMLTRSKVGRHWLVEALILLIRVATTFGWQALR